MCTTVSVLLHKIKTLCSSRRLCELHVYDVVTLSLSQIIPLLDLSIFRAAFHNIDTRMKKQDINSNVAKIIQDKTISDVYTKLSPRFSCCVYTS